VGVTLEFAYWLALGVGLGFLVLSLLLGDLFDFISFDFDIGGDFAAAPVFFTGAAAFGAGGLLGLNAFGLSSGMSVLVGLGFSIVLGGLSTLLFAALGRQEAKESFSTDKLVGARGRCTLAVEPGKQGRVAVQYGGMTRTHTATSDVSIAVGQEVVVTDVIGSTLRVSTVEASTPAQQA
jgi:membrane protein implicated in regulation of membrane protease activity